MNAREKLREFNPELAERLDGYDRIGRMCIFGMALAAVGFLLGVISIVMAL